MGKALVIVERPADYICIMVSEDGTPDRLGAYLNAECTNMVSLFELMNIGDCIHAFPTTVPHTPRIPFRSYPTWAELQESESKADYLYVFSNRCWKTIQSTNESEL